MRGNTTIVVSINTSVVTGRAEGLAELEATRGIVVLLMSITRLSLIGVGIGVI